MAVSIQGATALVTGANRGIGEAFVRALVAGGATRVYAGSRDPAAAEHLRAEAPGVVVPLALDVADAASIARAAQNCAKNDCSGVNILINNAGAFHGQRLIGADTLEAARNEMEVNYFGLVAMSRAFAPMLGAHDASAIVNVLSAGALCANPVMGGYSPSKFAARAATACIRAELASQGTQVSALIVGSVDTRLAAAVQGRKETPETIARAGIKAIERGITEMDTDAMAIELRAALARDPIAVERSMARMLNASSMNTGR